VATVVIAKWEGALDVERMNRLLNGEKVEEEEPQPAAEPAAV
jgi:aerobic C4-dicarboxylate transport protein